MRARSTSGCGHRASRAGSEGGAALLGGGRLTRFQRVHGAAARRRMEQVRILCHAGDTGDRQQDGRPRPRHEVGSGGSGTPVRVSHSEDVNSTCCTSGCRGSTWTRRSRRPGGPFSTRRRSAPLRRLDLAVELLMLDFFTMRYTLNWSGADRACNGRRRRSRDHRAIRGAGGRVSGKTSLSVMAVRSGQP